MDWETMVSNLMCLGESWGWLGEGLREFERRTCMGLESRSEVILVYGANNGEKIPCLLQMAPPKDKVDEKMVDFHER